MARFFEGTRAVKVNESAGTMSEQEDINSEFIPGDSDHEQSLISAEEFYHSSHSGRKHQFSNSDKGEDESDVESFESDSDCDSDEYYGGNRRLDEDDKDEYEAKEDDATDCSPTSVSDPLVDGSVKDSKHKEMKGSKRGNFLGRIFGGKKKKDGDESSKSIISSKSKNSNLHVFTDDSDSQRIDNGASNDSDIEVPLVDDESANSKKRTYGGRRVKYKAPAMPDVTEEIEVNKTNVEDEQYLTYSVPIQDDKENLAPNSGHVKKRVEDFNSMIKENNDKNEEVLTHDSAGSKSGDGPHTVRPDHDGDVDSDDSTPDPAKETTKKPKSLKTKGKKKGSKKAHPSASAATIHGAKVSSRIDHTGQISSATGPVSAAPVEPVSVKPERHSIKLQNEVYRLRSLVELMMARMELYERQSELLLEAAPDHSQEWKAVLVEKKRGKKSRVDEKLSDIKSLLMERSAQDTWIRQLEGVQRGYQQRLESTQKQLQTLRAEHIITKTKVMDMRKDKASLGDSGKTEHTPETVSESTKNLDHNESITPVPNNAALARWTGDSNPPHEVKIIGKPEDVSENGSRIQATDPEGRKIATLLEEMIVSWHSVATDLSPLSDKRDKKKKKKDKKKKKKKKVKDTGEIL